MFDQTFEKSIGPQGACWSLQWSLKEGWWKAIPATPAWDGPLTLSGQNGSAMTATSRASWTGASFTGWKTGWLNKYDLNDQKKIRSVEMNDRALGASLYHQLLGWTKLKGFNKKNFETYGMGTRHAQSWVVSDLWKYSCYTRQFWVSREDFQSSIIFDPSNEQEVRSGYRHSSGLVAQPRPHARTPSYLPLSKFYWIRSKMNDKKL